MVCKISDIRIAAAKAKAAATVDGIHLASFVRSHIRRDIGVVLTVFPNLCAGSRSGQLGGIRAPLSGEQFTTIGAG